ncbi:MAG: Tn3 family transposase [Pseudonocardiaceae bacterium]
MALVDRTAYPRLPLVLSARELEEWFSPIVDEVSWACAMVMIDEFRLMLLVLLKCYQRLGYFPRLEGVPPEAVEHVRGHAQEVSGQFIGPWGTLESGRMLKRCRELVRDRLGVVWEPTRVREVAEAAMRQALLAKDNPADVINVALEALALNQCELPAYSTLDRLAGALRAQVNGGFHRLVAGRFDAVERARLLGLLIVDPVSRQSALPRLTRAAPKATVSRLKQHVAWLRWLDELGPTATWLEGVPPAKIAHFAGEAAVLDADELSGVSEAKRLTLLVCLVHLARTRARDEVVTMFCKRMAVITKKAREKLDELREQHRAESERLLGVFGDVLAGVREALDPADTTTDSDGGEEGPPGSGRGVDTVRAATEPIGVVAGRAGRMVLKTLAEAGGVAELSGAHEAVSAHHGNNHTALMERYYRSHRSALFGLLEVLELESTSTDHGVGDAVAVLRANRHRVGEYLPDHHEGKSIDVSFTGELWRSTLRDRRRPDRLRRRHFEVCVFAHLAAELRTGDIAVVGSESYANLHTQLMSWDECRPLVADYCAQAGLPDTAAEAIAAWKSQLTSMAAAVDTGYPDNADLVIDAGRPVLKRRAGKERRASALALEAAIHQRLPERGLLEILARTAYRIGWTRHFGPPSGSDPKVRDAFGRHVATTFCYGTYLGPAQLARHMPGQVSAHELTRAFHQHCGLDRLHAAHTDVINAFAGLDITRLWGDGSVVAADGSQISTWENSLLAEISIRYGGVGKIAYRHVSDTYIALFTRFIPCGVWEAVYILDGLLVNDSDLQPHTIHADTQGQSLPVYGLATLLGFELLPRVRNWHDLIFYRPDSRTRYRHIDPLFGSQTIDWRLLEDHWPDLIRTAISIREGRISSITLLRRLRYDSHKNRLYRAFRELGRVMRTLVLLRYLSEPALRETITAITNRVEAFHGFAGWLGFGAEEGVIAHNDPVYQEKLVKFNQLIANCALYSTAADITAVVNELVADSQRVDPVDLATVSPLITHTIRRFGDWHLDLTPPEPGGDGHLAVSIDGHSPSAGTDRAIPA